MYTPSRGGAGYTPSFGIGEMRRWQSLQREARTQKSRESPRFQQSWGDSEGHPQDAATCDKRRGQRGIVGAGEPNLPRGPRWAGDRPRPEAEARLPFLPVLFPGHLSFSLHVFEKRKNYFLNLLTLHFAPNFGGKPSEFEDKILNSCP